MAKYRSFLSDVLRKPFITDGGLETTLIFHDGFDLPSFAAFTVLDNEDGREALRRYYRSYGAIAKDLGVGLLLESPTWRAATEWGHELGLSREAIDRYNRTAIELLSELRMELEAEGTTVLLSGCVGPRGDGYNPSKLMSAPDAERYHLAQIRTLSETDVDMIAALTMTNTEEAIGVVRAAQAVGAPCVISFTVETDGKLPTGTSIEEAIRTVDDSTGNGPIYYMINCAHPSHFHDELTSEGDWLGRIRGIRANASSKSHAELDEADTLDDGDPVELAKDYVRLGAILPNLSVLGGCCGTDHRHIAAIGEACLARV